MRARHAPITHAFARCVAIAMVAVVAVVAVSGDDADALIDVALEHIQDDRFNDAIATLERAVELEPGNTSAHHLLGQGYLAKLNTVNMIRKLGFAKKAVRSYKRAIALDAEYVEARVSLAQFYFNAPAIAGGGFDKGVEQVEVIKTLAPLRAHALMAEAYAEKKQPEKAEAEYRAAMAAAPDDPDLYYRLGLLYQGEEQWDKAFDAFDSGIEKADDARSLYQIGRTAVFAGTQLERGEKALLQYIEDEPEGRGLPSVAGARWRLGMIYEQMDRIDQARQQYEAALSLEPDNEHAKKSLRNLN